MLATANVLSGVLSGVPQGYVLGPLLFLIYIDGISEIPLVHESNRVIYADNICIYRPIYNSSDLQFVHDDIRAIEQWSTNNFLTLNSSKCKYMLISRKRNPTLPECPHILNNRKLQMLILINILVICCQKFCRGHYIHMHAICSKARNILGFLYRKYYNCSNSDTLKQLYILFRSQMDAWEPHKK